MKNLQELLTSLTPEIYQNLKRAVELGKWADGNRLSPEQRDLCMQAMIAYEHQHLPPEQHTGYIPPKPQPFCGDDHDQVQSEKPIKWM